MAQYTMALLWLGCRPTLTAEGLTDALNRARGDVPSIGIAVIQGDRVTSAVSGLRRADGADPIHLDDRWHLGSNTKAMTATLLAILCEEGLLRWDLPLSEAFPHQTLHPALATATLADLVAHRAGLLPLLDETPEGLREAIADRGAPIAECAASAAWILAQGPASPVGEYRYSNAGYIVLGAAIERATRTSWETLLTERVFAPLGMDACHFGPLALGHPGPWGHHEIDGRWIPIPPDDPSADNPPAIGPAGRTACSLAAWSRFIAAHLAPERANLPLSAPSWEHLHRPPAGSDYAGGWLLTECSWADGEILTQNGSNTSFYSSAWLAPSRELALIATTNAGGPRASGALDRALAEALKQIDR